MRAVVLLFFSSAVVCFGDAVFDSAQRRSEKNFTETRQAFQSDTNNTDTTVKFIRAAFDWGEYAKSNKQRAEIAEEAILICRALVQREPKLAAAHYYLAMNLGQLARTKSLGALKLVDEMEIEFLAAVIYDEHFDYAGPDRNLGQLYLEAPLFSVGDKKKARQHLERATQLEPLYPDNRLLLTEALLRWGEKYQAQKVLADLEKTWPQAKENFTGEQWDLSWQDWEARLKKIKARLSGSPQLQHK